jgi:hypothetical protein
MLAACGPRDPECLKDSKETATVLEIEEVCASTRYHNCGVQFQRMRLQREDGTVCGVERSSRWIYKSGDKVRGPL